MTSHWYAESSGRRTRQICADVAVALALVLCLRVGIGVHDLTADLAGPGRTLQAAGATLAQRMDEAGTAAGSVPLAGDDLAAPFTGAGDAGRAIEAAGVRQQHVVAQLAAALGWAAGGLLALALLASWLPWRIRFARRAGRAARLRDSGHGLDILALRALARQPLGDLLAAGPSLAEGWRNGDAHAVETLAALELRDLGLRPRRQAAR
jgi:hypothetical protein